MNTGFKFLQKLLLQDRITRKGKSFEISIYCDRKLRIIYQISLFKKIIINRTQKFLFKFYTAYFIDFRNLLSVNNCIFHYRQVHSLQVPSSTQAFRLPSRSTHFSSRNISFRENKKRGHIFPRFDIFTQTEELKSYGEELTYTAIQFHLLNLSQRSI